VDYTIDAAASQNRAMGWLAYLYDVSGELYYAVDQKLATFDDKENTLDGTAWTDQWEAGGNGDGTSSTRGIKRASAARRRSRRVHANEADPQRSPGLRVPAAGGP
jgi:hypothetical protein